MRTRNGYRYVIKVFEAQWDRHHDESVKPFFEQLKRDTEETMLGATATNMTVPGTTPCSATPYSRMHRG